MQLINYVGTSSAGLVLQAAELQLDEAPWTQPKITGLDRQKKFS